MTAATLPQPQGPVLYTGIVLYSTQDPEASALLVEDGTVAWIGPEDTATAIHSRAARVEATGCLLTPGFVDSVPTADGSVPDASWQQEAYARGITGHVSGYRPGRHDGIEVATPVDAPIPYLSLSSEGVPIAFGSGGRADAADPWSWVRAAAHEGPEDQRVSDRAAFLASSRAGYRLADRSHPGSLNPGAPATFVVWEPWDLTVRGQDERIQTWSTDPRSRTPMLPDLTEGAPSALRTVRDGVVVFDRLPAGAR
jgi:predicted amidohydrolase YtcJ